MFDDLFDNDDNPLASPKQLHIEVITPELASMLNQRWHSRLPLIHPSNIHRNRHRICFAFIHNGSVHGCAIWSSPVAGNRFKDSKRMLELRRMALADTCPRNTATRMLKLMRQHIAQVMPEVSLLISYQDTDVHHGTIYKADNWKLAATSKGLSWGTTRERNPDQTTAVKIRWEYTLKDTMNHGNI
jgi:hypothetical protein